MASSDFMAAMQTKKRIFDLVVSAIIAIPVLSACVLLAAAVRIIDRAPPLFRQQRVGRGGRAFQIYKLRTMHLGTPDQPTHVSVQSSVTRLGRFLRITKADELPQLFNVIRGDMSLVGPRPCLPSQGELIGYRNQLGLESVRPGITGVSQIAGLDMSNPRELALCDASYLQKWSLRKDISILTMTLFGGGTGDAIEASRSDEVYDGLEDR